MKERIVFYAGSFDPITNGHIDVLQGALAVADQVVLGIGIHPGKKPLFSYDDRVRLIEQVAKESLGKEAARIRVISFDGLVVDAARAVGASLMVRGLRDGTDLDYEMQMTGMNSAMAPDLRTIFLPASNPVRSITATLVRQIASMGGDVSSFVSPIIVSALKDKFTS